MKNIRFFTGSLLLSLMTMVAPLSATADERVNTTNDTLLQRIQVEDFMNDYYWELTADGIEGLAGFWAEDAVFDVNGDIIQGLAAIEEVYSKGLGPGGKLVFQMDIPRIRISGNTAVVDLIYTGILNADPEQAPALYEQGHDHVELVHANDEWKITRRVLRSFSLDQSYEQ